MRPQSAENDCARGYRLSAGEPCSASIPVHPLHGRLERRISPGFSRRRLFARAGERPFFQPLSRNGAKRQRAPGVGEMRAGLSAASRFSENVSQPAPVITGASRRVQRDRRPYPDPALVQGVGAIDERLRPQHRSRVHRRILSISALARLRPQALKGMVGVQLPRGGAAHLEVGAFPFSGPGLTGEKRLLPRYARPSINNAKSA